MHRAAIALLLVAGCAAPRVDFRSAPPIGAPHPDDLEKFRPCGVCLKEYGYKVHYHHVRKYWSRTVRATHDTWDTALNASLTLYSQEFREALVRMISGMRRLAPEQRAQLVAEQEGDQASFVEVAVVMETGRWEWNDLTSTRSLWTVTFIDDRGQIAPAYDVQLLEFKQDELTELFPDVWPFTRGWRVRFKPNYPDGTPLVRPDSRKVTVRMAGPLALVDVVWQARE